MCDRANSCGAQRRQSCGKRSRERGDVGAAWKIEERDSVNNIVLTRVGCGEVGGHVAVVAADDVADAERHGVPIRDACKVVVRAAKYSLDQSWG